MKPGLITLADLPALADGKNRSTIVVARLDDKLKDPRYGAFKITQSDVDGWQRNLADTFGGRVSIDFDHSSDRGGGTRASGWITDLHQDGKLVTADVEWTKRGAKAIRRGDYRHISPTFVSDFKDEHGQSRGKALIGAALTNRPVLRQGMPTLSLSRDRFDGVATPRKRPKNGRPMSKKSKTTVTLYRDGQLTTKKLSRKQLTKEVKRTLAGPRIERRVLAGAGASPDTVMTLAAFAPPGVAHAGTVDWNPPPVGAGRVPLGLDDSGRALHALIASRAASTGQPYFHAMADVTGMPDYREHSDVPPALTQQQGLDPEQAALYTTGRALAASAGISWMDAMSYLDHLAEVNALKGDTGTASVPWLDSRPLTTTRVVRCG
jgi:Mu-like prophage I protein